MPTPVLSPDLFPEPEQAPGRTRFAADAWRLQARALPCVKPLLEGLHQVLAQAPLRHMSTPGGRRIAVANTNAGPLGWVSDHSGYRYQDHDPQSGQAWPALPEAWRALAVAAAAEVGFAGFAPDACLVNQYLPGTRLSLHQDRNERDFTAPIVSISLGLPATFLFAGASRQGRPRRVPMLHGDVLVWGGASRLAFHGVAPLAAGTHQLLGARRINLTLRQAR